MLVSAKVVSRTSELGTFPLASIVKRMLSLPLASGSRLRVRL